VVGLKATLLRVGCSVGDGHDGLVLSRMSLLWSCGECWGPCVGGSGGLGVGIDLWLRRGAN